MNFKNTEKELEQVKLYWKDEDVALALHSMERLLDALGRDFRALARKVSIDWQKKASEVVRT